LFSKGIIELRKEELRLKSEKVIGEHRFEGTKNDEGQSGTICSANNGNNNANNGINI